MKFLVEILRGLLYFDTRDNHYTQQVKRKPQLERLTSTLFSCFACRQDMILILHVKGCYADL